jgi:hypothetical protein
VEDAQKRGLLEVVREDKASQYKVRIPDSLD